jgi:hypothetical protein
LPKVNIVVEGPYFLRVKLGMQELRVRCEVGVINLREGWPPDPLVLIRRDLRNSSARCLRSL